MLADLPAERVALILPHTDLVFAAARMAQSPPAIAVEVFRKLEPGYGAEILIKPGPPWRALMLGLLAEADQPHAVDIIRCLGPKVLMNTIRDGSTCHKLQEIIGETRCDGRRILSDQYIQEDQPYYAQRHLAQILRQIRERRGLSRREASQALSWPSSKLSRVESGLANITEDDLRAMYDLYQVSESHPAEHLMESLQVGARQAWWDSYDISYSTPFQKLIGLEGAAARILGYFPTFISGLLQTEEYSRSSLMNFASFPAQEREDRIRLRLRRQKNVFDRSDAAEVSVVLHEATLRTNTGDPSVNQGQLEQLLDLSAKPTFTLQITPLTSGFATIAAGTFIVLEFGTTKPETVAYTEGAFTEDFTDDPRQVSQYQEAFLRIQASALSTEESWKLLHHILRTLR